MLTRDLSAVTKLLVLLNFENYFIMFNGRGNNWNSKHVQIICNSLQSDYHQQHTSEDFLQPGCPSWRRKKTTSLYYFDADL